MADETLKLQQLLSGHGFDAGPFDGIAGPRTQKAVRRFQRAFAGGRSGLDWPLVVDGIAGPKTREALADLPWLSAHFRAAEFVSQGDGTLIVDGRLIGALEALRRSLGGRPLKVVSGYRDLAHNARVGGASRSQHLYGTAADLEYVCTVEHARGLEVFSGLGHSGGWIRHVDVRHLVPDTNPTPDVNPRAPATWSY